MKEVLDIQKIIDDNMDTIEAIDNFISSKLIGRRVEDAIIMLAANLAHQLHMIYKDIPDQKHIDSLDGLFKHTYHACRQKCNEFDNLFKTKH